MLDPHQDDPHRAVPADRQTEVAFANKLVNDFSCGIAMRFDLRWRRPIVVLLVQIVP